MKEAEELLEKYKAGLCTPEEVQLLQKWFHHLGENEVSELSAEDLIAAKLKFERHIKGSILPVRSYRLWPKIAVAAAAVAAVVFGVWFFNSRYDMNVEPGNEVATNDIAPGKNGATITLGNGEVIQLSDAKSGVVIAADLKYSDGSDVRYSSGSRSSGPASPGQRTTGPVGVRSLTPSELQGVNGRGQNLTASTAKGQTYQFTLPDGTRVWLNADSKISFPVQFSGRERRILLSGEGYFEVVKDKAHPFVVQTDKQTVTVLGTHFNVNAYKDENNTKTTLLEGSVRVAPLSPQGGFNSKSSSSSGLVELANGPVLPEGERRITLKPGQQSVLSGSNRISVKEVDIEEAVAWKEGLFIFKSASIENVMRQIERWYDVDVVYENEALKKEVLEGAASKYSNVSRILKAIENTGAVKFKIEGRKVFVMGK